MARTTSSIRVGSRLTYNISYGFLSGPAHSRRLRKLLKQLGYTQSKSPEQADIVIAHSAGCWLASSPASPKLVIFVGMTLPATRLQRTFKAAQRANIKAFIKNFHLLRGLVIGFYSLCYALMQPVRNRNIVRDAKRSPAVTEFFGADVVFIANRDDPWPHSDKLQTYLKSRDWAFISLPGSHNDIWEHSERYAVIIDHYAGLLV